MTADDWDDDCATCARSFRHRDDNVSTDLRATTYRYGGGSDDHGIQITLERDKPSYFDDGRRQALRLPRPAALAFAEWIVQTYAGTP